MRSFSLLVAAPLAVVANHMLLPRDLPLPIATNDTSLTDCASAAWPPSAVGVELVPKTTDEELTSMLSEIDPARIQAIIEKLVTFGTRHTMSIQNSTTRGIGAARNWIEQEMKTYAAASGGRMTVEVQSYIQPVASRISMPTRISNVMATLKGSTDPSRVYVISGHYDSRVTDVMNYWDDSPGADDDGSGVAIAMELARIMATHYPKATIVFTAVAGEEQNLYGSAFQANTFKNASVNVEGMLDNDIVGSPKGEAGIYDPYTIRLFAQGTPLTESTSVTSTRRTIGAEVESPARELARYVTENAANNVTGMNVATIYRLDRYLRGGDHASYLAAGYSAVRFTEPNEDYAHQHQDVRIDNTTGLQYGDLPEFCDYEYISRVGKVNMASLWSMANAPGIPHNVTVNSTLLSNDSVFKWIKSNATDLKGYEVVYRGTNAPQWTHMLDVGNVDDVLVPLSKDNVIFGIRAVGTNGYKSPAVLPFPA